MLDISNFKCDVVIVAGQSNAEGNGLGGTKLPLPSNVYQLYDVNPAFTADNISEAEHRLHVEFPTQLAVTVAEERSCSSGYCADLCTTFAINYVNNGLLKDDRKLLIIRSAVGGSGFAKEQWGVGNALSNRLKTMIEYALSQNAENKVVAMLWHQGEHDAYENPSLTDSQRHDFYLQKFTEQIRFARNVAQTNFPLVCGGFVKDWGSLCRHQCDAVELALQDACKTLGNASFVNSDGLLSNDQAVHNGDNIHFCRDSVYELGNRYFNAYKMLIQ